MLALAGLFIVLAFLLGVFYGKGFNITVNHNEYKGYENDEEYIEQPRVQDKEIEEYLNENNGLIKDWGDK